MIQTGDLFAIALPFDLRFVTGHVLLDIDNAATQRLIGKKSRLRERGTLMVNVYGPATPEPSPLSSTVLIPGVWTDAGRLVGPDRPRWKVIGNRKVDPPSVEFPEWVINATGGAMFERGEIAKPLPIDSAEVDRIGCSTPFISLVVLAKMSVGLLGRGDLLGENAILFTLDRTFDLRYSPHRAEVYRMLGQDPGRSYWDWATAEGLGPAPGDRVAPCASSTPATGSRTPPVRSPSMRRLAWRSDERCRSGTTRPTSSWVCPARSCPSSS